jgi:hypothetical protein
MKLSASNAIRARRFMDHDLLLSIYREARLRTSR